MNNTFEGLVFTNYGSLFTNYVFLQMIYNKLVCLGGIIGNSEKQTLVEIKYCKKLTIRVLLSIYGVINNGVFF